VHPILAEIFGPDLIIVIIVIVAVLFGGSQIPKLARSLGSAQSEFKKGLAEGHKASDTDAEPGKEAGKDSTDGGSVAKTNGNGSTASNN
jgi:sec-independent protein translocase protein TatA